MNAKPWQIGVIVVGLAVAAGLTVWNLSGSDAELPDTYLLIDVETGQIYRVNRLKHRILIPAQHPQTKKVSLVGLDKDDKGYFVNDHDLRTLKVLDEGVKNTVVDPKTGDLLVTPKDPIEYQPQ